MKWNGTIKKIVPILVFVLLVLSCLPIMKQLFGIQEVYADFIKQMFNKELGTGKRLLGIWHMFRNIAGLVIWLIGFWYILATLSKWAEDHLESYKKFIIWWAPVHKIVINILTYTIHFIYYILIISMNSTILLLVSVLLVIGLYSIIPTISFLFQWLMKLLFSFFALEFDASAFLVNSNNLKASDILGYQSITFFVILFAYCIKIMTQFVYSPLFLKIGGHRIVRKFLRLNTIFSYSYLRIIVYTIAFLAFTIQSSFKIMNEINSIFATFIIVDVIIYTFLSWAKSRGVYAEQELERYFHHLHAYFTEVEQQLDDKQLSGQEGNERFAAITFIAQYPQLGLWDKFSLYVNRNRRQRYFIARKVAVLLKHRYANRQQVLQAAQSAKRHILNARAYRPNPDYELLAIRLEEIKQEMEDRLRTYAQLDIHKEYLDKHQLFRIKPVKWKSRDWFFQGLCMLRSKRRMRELNDQYQQYLKSTEKMNDDIDRRYVEGISERLD